MSESKKSRRVVARSRSTVTAKCARLEAAGWRFGSAADFLRLDEEEATIVELRVAFGKSLREARAIVCLGGER